jgi:hypothetical protein
MPITPFLDGQKFDPETKRVMGVAFEMTRAALRLTDRNDPIIEIIAKKSSNSRKLARAIRTCFASGR